MSGLVICHGSQTGVHRGAHLGARDVGLPLAGYMPRDECDELGVIPVDVAQFMWRCTVGERDHGYPARTAANVELAHALLIVVPDLDQVEAFDDAALPLSLAKRADKPCMIAGPDTLRKDVMKWIIELRNEYPRELRLLVEGPRRSLWDNGEAITRTLISGFVKERPVLHVAGGGLAY